MNKEMHNSPGDRFHLKIITGDLNPCWSSKVQSPANLLCLVQKHNYSGVAQTVCYAVAAQWMKPQKMRGKSSSIIPASSQFTVCCRFCWFFSALRLPPQRSVSPLCFVLFFFSLQLLMSCRAAWTLSADSLDKSPLIHHARSVNFSSVLCASVFFFYFYYL